MTYKVHGQTAGMYKQAGTFSYLRIYGAGHSVPAYSVCVTHPLFVLHGILMSSGDQISSMAACNMVRTNTDMAYLVT